MLLPFPVEPPLARRQKLFFEALLGVIIPICFQDEIKARRIPGCWRGASEAHIRRNL
jgi:hypothetical protein